MMRGTAMVLSCQRREISESRVSATDGQPRAIVAPRRCPAESRIVSKSYRGACFCGAVAITVAGEPLAMGYCHCASCRHWSAAPVSAFALWPTDALKVVAGADKLGSF